MHRILFSLFVCLAASLPAMAEDEPGWMGLAFYNITPELATAMQAEGETGVVVVGVAEGSSAAIAGLKRNDILTAIDNQDMPDGESVIAYTQDLRAGRTALVTIIREGSETTIPLMLVPKPEDLSSVKLDYDLEELQSAGGSFGSGEYRALELAPATPEQLSALGLPPGTLGFAIKKIDILSLAGLTGLKVGMVIVEIEQQPFRTFDLLEFYIREAALSGKDYITFGVYHEGEVRNVPVRVPTEYKAD